MTIAKIGRAIAEFLLVAVLATAWLILQSCTDDPPLTPSGATCTSAPNPVGACRAARQLHA